MENEVDWELIKELQQKRDRLKDILVVEVNKLNSLTDELKIQMVKVNEAQQDIDKVKDALAYLNREMNNAYSKDIGCIK